MNIRTYIGYLQHYTTHHKISNAILDIVFQNTVYLLENNQYSKIASRQPWPFSLRHRNGWFRGLSHLRSQDTFWYRVASQDTLIATRKDGTSIALKILLSEGGGGSAPLFLPSLA